MVRSPLRWWAGGSRGRCGRGTRSRRRPGGRSPVGCRRRRGSARPTSGRGSRGGTWRTRPSLRPPRRAVLGGEQVAHADGVGEEAGLPRGVGAVLVFVVAEVQ